MLADELVGILREVEELGFTHLPLVGLVLDQFPVTLLHTAHPRAGAAAIHAVEDLADRLLPAEQDGLETGAFAGPGNLDPGQVTESRQNVEEVDVALHPGAPLDSRSLHDEGNPPGVLVEVLLALQAVAANGHPVVGGVNHVGVVQFPHCLQLAENPADLDVDVLAAGELATEFVTDGPLVAPGPDTLDPHLVPDRHVGVVKRMPGQVVGRKGRLLRIRRRQGVLVGVIDRPVLVQKAGLAVAHVVRMGEPEVDQEGIRVLPRLPPGQEVQDLPGMPGTSALVGASPLGGIMPHGEEGVGLFIAVAPLAGPHGVVARPVEDSRHRVHGQVRRNQPGIGDVRVHGPARLVRDVPDRAARHDHVPRRRADSADPGSHVMGSVKHHAGGRQRIEIRGLEGGIRIVDLQVKGRLVVGDDEQDVGALVRRRARDRNQGNRRQQEEARPEERSRQEGHERWD